MDYLYMDPPRGSLVPSFLRDAIAAVKDEAWTGLALRDRMLRDADSAADFIALAEASPEEARPVLICVAADRIENVRSGVDGFAGGEKADDSIADCYEASGVLQVAESLLEGISSYLVEPPERP